MQSIVLQIVEVEPSDDSATETEERSKNATFLKTVCPRSSKVVTFISFNLQRTNLEEGDGGSEDWGRSE
jgi:hypothetical protein